MFVAQTWLTLNHLVAFWISSQNGLTGLVGDSSSGRYSLILFLARSDTACQCILKLLSNDSTYPQPFVLLLGVVWKWRSLLLLTLIIRINHVLYMYISYKRIISVYIYMCVYMYACIEVFLHFHQNVSSLYTRQHISTYYTNVYIRVYVDVYVLKHMFI